MTAAEPLATLTPFLHFTHLESLSTSDLDQHCQRAENCMNQALDQRNWSLVRCYRDVMLAVRHECDRRLSAVAADRDRSRKLGDHR